MSRVKISWSSLLNLSELEFVPAPPLRLILSDDIAFSLAILTAATRHDRKMLRCDSNGALLVSEPWNGLVAVETDELMVNAGSADSFTATVANKGVLLATTGKITSAAFVKVSGGSSEVILIAPDSNFWYAGPVYSVTVDDVPAGAGYTFYVGVTTFN